MYDNNSPVPTRKKSLFIEFIEMLKKLKNRRVMCVELQDAHSGQKSGNIFYYYYSQTLSRRVTLSKNFEPSFT